MTHILLFQWILIHMCVVDTLSQNVVRGVRGQAVTLPCTYNVWQSGGLTDMCWGRGSCPSSKCNQEILRTNGKRVVSRTSPRYSLRGSITNGDVSLMIVNVNERDRGLYCCRIEIRGWFNDIKKTLSLQVETAITTAPTTTTAITTTTAATTRQVVTSLITTAPLTNTVTHSIPSFPFLTTKPSSSSVSNTTNSPTTATSSRSTATSFLSTTLQFVNIKSPTTFQDKSTENSSRVFTTETASSATGATFVLSMSETTENSEISTSSGSTSALSMSETTEKNEISTSPGLTLKSLDFSKKYYPVLILCILGLGGVLLIVAIQLIKRKNMRKYQLGKMKSLINEGEEPEQTPSETEGENGMFPL